MVIYFNYLVSYKYFVFVDKYPILFTGGLSVGDPYSRYLYYYIVFLAAWIFLELVREVYSPPINVTAVNISVDL